MKHDTSALPFILLLAVFGNSEHSEAVKWVFILSPVILMVWVSLSAKAEEWVKTGAEKAKDRLRDLGYDE
jgi:hypothetical protein